MTCHSRSPSTRAHFATVAVIAAAALALRTAPVRAADDDDLDDAEPSTLTLTGHVRGGWRLLSGRDEGNFLQDVNLGSGARIFDLYAALRDASDDALIDEIELEANDLGERSSDGRIVLRRGDKLRIEGGLSRDLFDYRASGDPFPLDTVRERSYARVRYAPSRRVTVRFAWERSDVHGEADRRADTDRRELPPPAGVDPDVVFVRRPIEQLFDTFDVGVDVAVDAARFSVTQTVRRGRVDDERLYDVPPARRGADPVREELRRLVRSTTWSTVAKAGLTLLDGDLDLSLVGRYTRRPGEAAFSGAADGFDNAFSGVDPKGAYSAVTGGETDLDAHSRAWTFDGTWQAHDQVELAVSVEQDETVEDADLMLTETRDYDRLDVGREVLVTRRRGRATNRVDRALVETIVDVTDDVRVRVGREWLTQDVAAPFESRRGSRKAGVIRGQAARWVAGVDVDATEDVSASLLVRRSDEREPHASKSAEEADEITARVRARVSESLSLTGTYRYRGFQNGERFDSRTRAESAAIAATYGAGPWSAQLSVARQAVSTRTDTSLLFFDGTSLLKLSPTLAFRTHDVVVAGGASYKATPRLRFRTDAVLTRTGGDRRLDTRTLSLGAEYDIREDLTVGATARTWRYDEHGRSVDDYSAEALEIALEWRF